MGNEIELKLTIDETDIDQLIRHPFLLRHLADPVTRKCLVSHYYDTPDRILYRHHMALRVRWDGDTYIQTLKQKGRNRNGLSERGEWEWVLKSFEPDIALIPVDLLPIATEAPLAELARVFDTNFERTQWPLRLPVGNLPQIHVPARMDVALDQGFITAKTKQGIVREKMLELELELLEGEIGALHSVWELLKEQIRLEPCNVSKAQRGYGLLGC